VLLLLALLPSHLAGLAALLLSGMEQTPSREMADRGLQLAGLAGLRVVVHITIKVVREVPLVAAIQVRWSKVAVVVVP
tara:strand:- start:597 stop:830 length:234 start_codon:yes stop_codon:yes gene_type:complete